MHSGYINWAGLVTQQRWVDTEEGGTWVYAFWTAEHKIPPRDSGLEILDTAPKIYPDPMVLADGARFTIGAQVKPDVLISPNRPVVYDHTGRGVPVIGALLLGSTTGTWQDIRRHEYWWCGYHDLTWRGRRVVRQTSKLYRRAPHILTYLSLQPIDPAVPETTDEQATFDAVSGQTVA